MEQNSALTAQDVADILKISKNTVYELIKRGEINSYKVGRKVRFTLQDIDEYISRSKKLNSVVPSQTQISEVPKTTFPAQPLVSGSTLIISGQDILLDLLSKHLQQDSSSSLSSRSYVSSYKSLSDLYFGHSHIAAIHLWDRETNQYNIPYVKRFLPGISTVVVHLAKRVQGFYVAKGNPKAIKDWNDLDRPDITMINREKGAGSRILLDEHLHEKGISPESISGYNRESQSSITVATTVARGGADLAIGHEQISKQVNDIDFIPLQEERYELVIKKEDFKMPEIQLILDILISKEFQDEVSHVSGYDTSDLGKIIAEL